MAKLHGYSLCADVSFRIVSDGILASNHRAREHGLRGLSLFDALAGADPDEAELRLQERVDSDPEQLERAARQEGADFAPVKPMVSFGDAPALEMICEPAATGAPTLFEAVQAEEPLCGPETVRTALEDDPPGGLPGFRWARCEAETAGMGARVPRRCSAGEALRIFFVRNASGEVYEFLSVFSHGLGGGA